MNAHNAPATIQPDTRLAILMHRLSVCSGKLDLVVEHYPPPGQCQSDDIGAIALTRDVASELMLIYCGLNEWTHEKGLLQDGPVVERWDIDEEPAAEAEL